MDMSSLIAANMPAKSTPPRMDAKAEDRYYASQLELPQPNFRVLGSIAMTAVAILIVIGT
ncbi:MAG: hypothetical protein JWR51_1246 [Devosia sp.]|uniref:hypothetical protein n=1 Tax=Devosia sp. TaxID=1871048 RepID=UPI00262A169D|nr:hypothetical protein [Devosia sp.]MDB5528143.1 hypothetical protein [Devosia sp.]